MVVITGFSDKKMSGLLFGPQKSGRNNGVVVWRGSTVLKLGRNRSKEYSIIPKLETEHLQA